MAPGGRHFSKEKKPKNAKGSSQRKDVAAGTGKPRKNTESGTSFVARPFLFPNSLRTWPGGVLTAGF